MEITHNSICEIEGAILRHFYSTNSELEYTPEITANSFTVNLYLNIEKKLFKEMIIESLKDLDYRYELSWDEENSRFILKIYSSDVTIKNIVGRHNFNRPKSKEKKNANRNHKIRS